MHQYKTAFTKFFKNSEGKIVLWQVPNIPLVGWLLCAVLARIVSSEKWQDAIGSVGFGFLFTWAWLEITQGGSYFRRTLGLVVLAASIYSRF